VSTATAELVVPRSIPMVLPMWLVPPRPGVHREPLVERDQKPEIRRCPECRPESIRVKTI
jgi:hypothetical protein